MWAFGVYTRLGGYGLEGPRVCVRSFKGQMAALLCVVHMPKLRPGKTHGTGGGSGLPRDCVKGQGGLAGKEVVQIGAGGSMAEGQP